MGKPVIAFDVFLAGPSDAPLDGVRDAVSHWNSRYSHGRDVFLRPSSGKDARREVRVGATAQSVIDDQVLDKLGIEICVVVFNATLGGGPNRGSGTVHELTKAAKHGVLCLVYFADPPSFDGADRAARMAASELDHFRDELESEANDIHQLGGLVGTFTNADDLREQVVRDLSNAVDQLHQGQDEVELVDLPRMQTEFDARGDEARLRVQADHLQELDDKALPVALERIRALRGGRVSVLDAGCADGYVTLTRFGRLPYVDLIGLDRLGEVIAKARERYHEFSGDLGLDNVAKMDFVVGTIAEFAQAGRAFDLVFCALTLHHVGDSLSCIQHLWDMVAPGGALVVRGSDDGTKIHYPDPNEAFAKFVEDSSTSPASSDRYYGRKVFPHMRRLSPLPNSIQMEFQVDSTVGLDREQLKNYYLDNHGFRADAAIRHARATKQRRDVIEARRMGEVRDSFLGQLEGASDVFSMTVQNIAIAWKPEREADES